jgi:hypothetical protein
VREDGYEVVRRAMPKDCWWPNLINLEKTDSPVSGSGYSDFDSSRVKSKKKATWEKSEDSIVFGAWKRGYENKEPKKKKIGAWSWSRKNWTIRFGILEYSIFP